MFSEKSEAGRISHEGDFVSLDYQNLRVDISQKTKAASFDDIDDLVDDILIRNNISIHNKSVKNKHSKNISFRNKAVRRTFQIINRKLPVRKILTVVMSLIIIFVVIPSILPWLYGSSDFDVTISLDPDGVRVNETLFINVTIPSSYNITSATADMVGVETVDLTLVDNTTFEHLWQGTWVVHDIVPGMHIMTIYALDDVNGSYVAGTRLSVLPEEVPVDNQPSEPDQNETIPPDVDDVNGSTNDTVLPDIDDTNVTDNESVVPVGLNLSLDSDKDAYFVNETVSIDGTVSYNNSLINTSVSLLIVGPDYDLSESLNATDGEFYYQIVPTDIGNYAVQVTTSFENETVMEELLFSVQNLSLINVSELYVWDDTDYQQRFVGDEITFFANYSLGNLGIVNASCLISFDVGNWTMPMIMNYSDGFYVYSQSFEVAGTYEYRVWCSASGFENKTMVGECVISITEPRIFEPVSQIEIGKPALWKQRFQAEENLTVNISGYAYNISVSGIIFEDDVIVLEKNVRKNLREYNIIKGKHVLAKGIRSLLKSVKRDLDELQSKQELYQLYSMLKDNISLDEILNETYGDIEQYLAQFIIEDVEIQLLISNISDEVEITYLTEGPEIEEEQLGRGRKRITVSSDIHYENILTYASIVESPKNNVKLYWVVGGSYELVRDVTYVDTNNNDLIDKIEWITPYLSNQTYEVIIITKAIHLDENREFISDIYDEVYRKDGVWSEPIYHDEYVRVTFEQNLTNRNDITFYAGNNQNLDTIVEVYYYDSDEKITEFPIIEQEDFYKVYLTGMTGRHQIFDLKIKNLDNINSAYLEFDYIVDPDTKDAVDSNVADVDSSADKGTETDFENSQDITIDADIMTIEEANQGGGGGENFNNSVDDNTGDLDGVADVGTENDFANAQSLTVDGSSMTLIEANLGGGVEEDLYVNAFDATYDDWILLGSSPYLDAADGTSTQKIKSAGSSGWYDFPSTTLSGTLSVDAEIYMIQWDGDILVEFEWTGDATPETSIQTTGAISSWVDLGTVTGLDTVAEINACRVRLTWAGAKNDWLEADASRLEVTGTSTDYEADFEYKIDGCSYNETVENLCIYHVGEPLEDLIVQYWTSGDAWSTLGNIDNTGWNNFTATGLTNKTYYIRLYDENRTNEATQTTWTIDTIKIASWNNTASDDYEIDFEYSWSDADYGETNEELCFYLTTTPNENLSVDYWKDDDTWSNLGGISNMGWTNLTATGLSNNTYFIRVYDENQTNEVTQTTWNIDVIMLHTWPTISTPTVITNASTGVEETTATIWGFLESNGSADTICWFLWDTDNDYANNESQGVKANRSEFSKGLTTLISGDLYYFKTKANNSAGWDESGGELTFFTKPEDPDSITESTTTNTTVTFSVDLADVGSDATSYTYAEYSKGPAPSTRGTGTLGFNSTSVSPQITGLDPGTKYNVSAWAWGEEGGIGQYSDAYVTTSFWTNPGDPTGLAATNGSSWVNITFTHGTNGSYTMVRRNASGSAAYPSSRASGTQVDNTTNTYVNDTGLVAVTYYYALWTWDTDGGKWCDYQTNITGTIVENISINVTPSWNIGAVTIGNNNYSTENNNFTLENEGNVMIDIQVNASNATNGSTGAEWKLASSPDYNNFTLQYNKSSDISWTNINTTYDTFHTGLAIGTNITFDLNFYVATTASKDDPLSFTITFKSVAS